MEIFGWLGSEATSGWAALGGGRLLVFWELFSFLLGYFIFIFSISVLYIRATGHGDSVWVSGGILTATAH